MGKSAFDQSVWSPDVLNAVARIAFPENPSPPNRPRFTWPPTVIGAVRADAAGKHQGMRSILKGNSGDGCYEYASAGGFVPGARVNYPSMRSPPDHLDPLLERWRALAPKLETPLAPDVWRRIRTAQGAERPCLLAALAAAFARPSFAAAFVTACVLAGLFVAELRVSRLQAERNVQLARSYVRLIDPLLNKLPPGAIAAAASHQ